MNDPIDLLTGIPTTVVPDDIRLLWARTARLVTGGVDARDRRGFRLLHWTSPLTAVKPVELSLEHEVRLKGSTDASAMELLVDLMSAHGRKLRDPLPEVSGSLGDLVIEQFDRKPGPQSFDVYWDGPTPASIVDMNMTFRQRRRTSAFMTWIGSAPSGLHPFNLELPSFHLDLSCGLIVRLEFNWLDHFDPLDAFRRPGAGMQWHPLSIVSTLYQMPFMELRPFLEHSTTRQKFNLVDAGGSTRFNLNIDIVETWPASGDDSQRHRYLDVDLAPAEVVDERQVDDLRQLGGALCSHYLLTANLHTKAFRDKETLRQAGVLGQVSG